MERIDGSAIAKNVREQIAAAVAQTREMHGITPGLSLVIVGDDEESARFVRRKAKLAEKAGMRAQVLTVSGDVGTEDLLALVARLNADDAVDGVLVQLPLPAGLDEAAVTQAIEPAKDVDGLHPLNLGLLAAGAAQAVVPPTPWGVGVLLTRTLGPDGLSGKRAVVLGRSTLVGRPTAYWLLREDCTVTVAHSKSADVAALCREAEILVSAVGKPGFVRGDWIRHGATVIDVGLTGEEQPDGKWKMLGDVAFDESSQRAAHLTPVPGGVGPMTVAGVLANSLFAACRRRGLAVPRIT